MKKNTITTVAFMLFSALLWGQGEAADFMRSTGKIYVVVAVIVTIFIGIVLFLIYLDRKLTKLENQINDND
ncbi:MAG: CcmD family protein [Phaeodactylibacter sp.]|nr:CcmD family protein [Phaeodactylibacter sp.]